MKLRGSRLLNRLPIAHALREERGSAVIEFVVLTLPLFVPFALYLSVINSQSQISFDAHNLARQIARAYISSPSEELTAPRVDVVSQAFQQRVLRPHGISSIPNISIRCSASPCLTPGASVQVTVSLQENSAQLSGYLRFLNTSSNQVTATDTQVVDKWRNT